MYSNSDINYSVLIYKASKVDNFIRIYLSLTYYVRIIVN